MIPESHKITIISNGIHFIRSITEAYGPEQGMQLWDQIASVLDPDVKGEIFFTMLTGTNLNKIELKGVSQSANAVACIKEIRNWTGFGLKEAKDVFDRLRYYDPHNGTQSEMLTIKHEEYTKAVIGLKGVGFLV